MNALWLFFFTLFWSFRGLDNGANLTRGYRARASTQWVKEVQPTFPRSSTYLQPYYWLRFVKDASRSVIVSILTEMLRYPELGQSYFSCLLPLGVQAGAIVTWRALLGPLVCSFPGTASRRMARCDCPSHRVSLAMGTWISF